MALRKQDISTAFVGIQAFLCTQFYREMDQYISQFSVYFRVL